MILKRYVGTGAFYKTLLAVAIPIVVQNGITNFISLLDNIMVGQVGTEQMSGVSIVNQLLLIFNLCIFGALSGVGLFSAQFFGKRDHDGVRYTFRFKFLVSLVLCAVALLLFSLLGEPLVRLYLHEGGDTGDLDLTLGYAKEYLTTALLGLLPYTITQVYASTLREIKHTVPPMTAGLIGVGVNLILNYLLIFGAFGFPRMGVTGAALATVTARFVECIIVVLWTHTHAQKCVFIKGVYTSFYVPRDLVGKILRTGTPLLVNETLWAIGQATLLQCYSLRGIASVSAMNISGTVLNTFSVIYLSIGTSISILIGHRLGAGEKEEAMADSRKMIAFAAFMGILAGCLIAVCAPLFPRIYNTTDEVRSLATTLTLIVAAAAPIQAILNACYFTLRSGGKTLLTFVFDSGYVWCVNIPLAFLLSRLTALPTATIFLICQSSELIKWILGIVLVEKGIWLNDITNKNNEQQEARV